jgi:hypothetical protein
MKDTMLFKDIEVPVLSIEVVVDGHSTIWQRYPGPNGLWVSPLGDDSCRLMDPRRIHPQIVLSEFTDYVKNKYALILDPPAKTGGGVQNTELPRNIKPIKVDVSIQFPTFRWASHYGASSPEAIPTASVIIAGKIELGRLILEDGLSIPGLVVEHSEAIKAEAFVSMSDAQKEFEARAQDAGLLTMVKMFIAAQGAGERAREADSVETKRLLHRMLRKVEGVPPMVDRLAITGESMAAATVRFRQKVNMSNVEWDVYEAMQRRDQNQTRTAHYLGMKQYQVSRIWKKIKAKFMSAGCPITEKLTRHTSRLDVDGVFVKKSTKKRKRHNKVRPTA